VLSGRQKRAFLVGDALDLLPNFPDSSVSTWITSPPYFRLKRYGRRKGIGSERTYAEYLSALQEVWIEAFRASKPGASLWVIADHVKKGGVLKLLPFDLSAGAQSAGWTLRDVFIWNKRKALPWSRPGELRNGFEHVVLLTKGNGFSFKVDRIRDARNLQPWWIKYPERYNPRGKVPEGVWDFDIPTQGSWGPGFIEHPCPFPPALVERMLLLSTDPGDLVVDPFAGTGAVVAEAVLLNRRSVGIELEAKYLGVFERVSTSNRTKRSPQNYTGPQKALQDRIWSLRKLKYAREVLRLLRLAPGTARVLVAQVDDGTPRFGQGSHAITLRLLVGPGKDLERLRAAVDRLGQRPPLSKYQLSVKVEVTDSAWEWQQGRHWVYRRGKFWDFADEAKGWNDVLGPPGRKSVQRGWPPLVSAMRIQLSEPPDPP
jgi:DNA modification methylase